RVQSLLVVLIHDLGVYDILRTGARAPLGSATGRSPLRAACGARAGAPGLRVQLGAGLLHSRVQAVVRGLDRRGVGAAQRRTQVAQRLVDARPGVLRQLVAALGEELLGLPQRLLRQVAGLRLLPAALVLLGVLLVIAHHPLDVLLGHVRAAGARHRHILAGVHVPDAAASTLCC